MVRLRKMERPAGLGMSRSIIDWTCDDCGCFGSGFHHQGDCDHFQAVRANQTEDACQTRSIIRECGEPAHLLLHVMLVARGAVVDTMLLPVCARCYQLVIDDPPPMVLLEMVPRDICERVKFWTSAEYRASWPGVGSESEDRDGDDQAAP